MVVTDAEAEPRNIEGGIVAYDTTSFWIQDCTFRNLKGNSTLGGGAIYATQGALKKGNPNNYLWIESSLFESCQNINGGAITIDNMENVKIVAEC